MPTNLKKHVNLPKQLSSIILIFVLMCFWHRLLTRLSVNWTLWKKVTTKTAHWFYNYCEITWRYVDLSLFCIDLFLIAVDYWSNRWYSGWRSIEKYVFLFCFLKPYLGPCQSSRFNRHILKFFFFFWHTPNFNSSTMSCDVIIINFYYVGVVLIIALFSIPRTYPQGLVI